MYIIRPMGQGAFAVTRFEFGVIKSRLMEGHLDQYQTARTPCHARFPPDVLL
jgi:hypothetical protein